MACRRNDIETGDWLKRGMAEGGAFWGQNLGIFDEDIKSLAKTQI